MDLRGKRINVGVLFDTVQIAIHCGDDYEAQVLFDDIAETMKAGGKFVLTVDEADIVPADKPVT